MARKRKDLGEAVGAKIAQMMQRGGTAESIAAATGQSRATIGRRMRELKATGRPAPVDAAPLPAGPEDVPTDAPMALLDQWLETARQGAEQAKLDGDLSQVAAMGRLAVSISEAKRKATPVPVADPNEHPDMVLLGAKVSERLHVLIDQVTG